MGNKEMLEALGVIMIPVGFQEHVSLEFQGEPDSLVCVCGNTASRSGFETCNKDGEVVEPVVSEWVDDTILCVACSRIISQSALVVVGKK